MTGLHRLSSQGKKQTAQRLGDLLASRPEVCFACIHGSFLDPRTGFHDIDIAVWVDPSVVPAGSALEYQWELASWLENQVPHSIDVLALNYAPNSLRYSASGGLLLMAVDHQQWYTFREESWNEYLDFAPIARQALHDLLDPGT